MVRAADSGRIRSPDQLLEHIEIVEPDDLVVAEFDEVLRRHSSGQLSSTGTWFQKWIHDFLQGSSAPDVASLLLSKWGAVNFDESELEDATFRARLLCKAATGMDHISLTLFSLQL